MPPKHRNSVYRVTRKAPTGVRVGEKKSLRYVVWRAMKDLRQADRAKLVAHLIEQREFQMLQLRNPGLHANPAKYVYQQVWRLVQEGVVEEFPDRRYYGVRGRGF